MNANDIPIPDSWPGIVKKAMIHTVSLARYTMLTVHGWGEYHQRKDIREATGKEISRNENAILKKQLELLMRRYGRLPARKRPYYSPPERMEILLVKAAEGWNLKQTVKAFMVEEATISSWMQRLEEDGADALVKISEPVNKYPEFLHYTAQKLKALIPLLGKEKTAEYFMRAGINLSASSIGRFLKTIKPDKPFFPDPEIAPEEEVKVVSSRHPDHTYMIDLTVVPISQGMWTSWSPFALFQCWPFCWWVAVVIDHFSRKVVSILAFPKQPTAEQIVELLDKTVESTGKKPKYIISDKGNQFHPPKNAKFPEKHPYRKWCHKNGIKPRYGAIGCYGSIAIIERFMKTLKNLCTHRIIIPYNLIQMQEELVLFVMWYNQYRPHSAFQKEQNNCEVMGARTPQEIYDGFKILKMPNAPPVCHNCDLPSVKIDIAYLEGRRHLPIIEIKAFGSQQKAS